MALDAVRASFGTLVEVSDLALANGVQPPAPIAASVRARPRSHLSDEQMSELVGRRDRRVRHYKWLRIEQGGGEVILSWFLRCNRDDRNLFVEVNQALLTPVANDFRWIDGLTPVTLGTHVAWLQGALIAGPVQAVWQLVTSPFRALAAVARALGIEEAAIRKQIARDPLFDFGVLEGLRTRVSGAQYTHYYQKVDRELGQKTVDRELFNALIDFLSEHNIDTSALQEGQSMILNNGIIVQQGNITAESLAVGAKAKASKRESIRNVVRGVGRAGKSPVKV